MLGGEEPVWGRGCPNRIVCGMKPTSLGASAKSLPHGLANDLLEPGS